MCIRTYKHDDPASCTRTCKTCLSVLEITTDNYYRDKTKPLGFSVVCKPCMTAVRHAKKPPRVVKERKPKRRKPKKVEATGPSPTDALSVLVVASVTAARWTRDIKQFNDSTVAFGAAASDFVDTIMRNPDAIAIHFGHTRPINAKVIEAGLRYDAGEPCTDFDKATNRPLTPTPSDEALMFSDVLSTSTAPGGPQSTVCLPKLGLDLLDAAVAAGLDLRSPYADP